MWRRALLTSRRHINVYKPGDVVRLKHRRWKKLPDRKLAGAEAETWRGRSMARGGVRMSQPFTPSTRRYRHAGAGRRLRRPAVGVLRVAGRHQGPRRHPQKRRLQRTVCAKSAQTGGEGEKTPWCYRGRRSNTSASDPRPPWSAGARRPSSLLRRDGAADVGVLRPRDFPRRGAAAQLLERPAVAGRGRGAAGALRRHRELVGLRPLQDFGVPRRSRAWRSGAASAASARRTDRSCGCRSWRPATTRCPS